MRFTASLCVQYEQSESGRSACKRRAKVAIHFVRQHSSGEKKYLVTRQAIPDAAVLTRFGVVVVDAEGGVFSTASDSSK